MNIMHVLLHSGKAFKHIFASTIVCLSLPRHCELHWSSYVAQSLIYFCTSSKHLCQALLTVLVFSLICNHIIYICTCFTKWILFATYHKDCNICTEKPLKHQGTGKGINGYKNVDGNLRFATDYKRNSYNKQVSQEKAHL